MSLDVKAFMDSVTGITVFMYTLSLKLIITTTVHDRHNIMQHLNILITEHVYFKDVEKKNSWVGSSWPC